MSSIHPIALSCETVIMFTAAPAALPGWAFQRGGQVGAATRWRELLLVMFDTGAVE